MIALDTNAVVAVMALFAFLGLRRGASKELLSLVGVLVATVVTTTQHVVLTQWVNRLYRFGMFAAKGGLTAANPGEVMANISALTPPISTPEQEGLLVVAAFAVILALFYLLGEDRIPTATDPLQRVLGLFVGALNGYLAGRFLFPRLFPGERTHVTILSSQISDYLSSDQTLIWAIVGFCLIMIVYGVRSSSRPPRRQ